MQDSDTDSSPVAPSDEPVTAETPARPAPVGAGAETRGGAANAESAGADGVENTSGVGLRVLLILDQLEELWTGQRITATMRDEFLSAVAALTQTGWIAALATLRSDFYPRAQVSLQRLKGEHGHFDLAPPEQSALQRMITHPARRAGLRFERKADSEDTLDQTLIDEASSEKISLPLVEYALDELDRRRESESRTLTFAALEELGGLKGALGNRAVAVFRELPPEVQAALDEILPLLVTAEITEAETTEAETTESESVVRRWPRPEELQSGPARRALT
jgi:hypothetical protein